MQCKGLYGLILLLLYGGSQLDATTIAYDAVDLADSIPGEDLWAYIYRVGGFDFASGQGFFTRFEREAFAALSLPRGNELPGWDQIVIQPDINLPDDGFFDALAVAGNPSLASPFVVHFVFLGPAPFPASQEFTVYQVSSPGGIPDVLETGYTQPAVSVPEPAEDLLFLTAAALLCCRWALKTYAGRADRLRKTGVN